MTEHTPEEIAEGLVEQFLDQRLRDAEEPPGLRNAVVNRLAGRFDKLGERARDQASQLRSPSSRRIPDAYFVDEEAIENDLQTSAAGIRTAMALEGVLSSPRQFESDLAHLVAPSAQWALRGEASRVPRPSTRPSVLAWSLAPIPWAEDSAAWPPSGALSLDGVRQLTGADGGLVRVVEEPHAGWVQLGMFERQGTLATTYPEVPARQVLIAVGLEACDSPPHAHSMPVSSSPPNAWSVTYDRLLPGLDSSRAETALKTSEGPLAAIADFEGQPGAPARGRGVGLQLFTLVPRLDIIALLGLRPEMPALRQVLIDDKGPALIGRQWHGFLIHDGNYSPLEPAVHGSDLILRPDLYDALEGAVGKDRLVYGVTVHHTEEHAPRTDRDNDD